MGIKTIAKNQYIFAVFTKILIVILGVFSSIFINRYLGPSLKGEYAYTLNIVNIVVLILNLGIYQSYPFYSRKNGQEMKNKYFNIVMIQFMLYLLIGVIFSLFFESVQLTIVLTLVPLMIITKQLNFIALVENVNLRNKLNIGNQAFYVLLLLFVFLYAPQKILFVFLALCAKDIIIIIRIIKVYQLRFSLRQLDGKLAISVIRFGIFPMLSALLMTANYNIDIIILGLYVEYVNIGYYSVGVTLANQVWLIPDAFKDVLFSKTAKSDAIDEIKLSIKINLYISVIIIFLIGLLGKPLISILYGIEYLPAYSVTVVIFTGLIPMIFYKMIISLFNARGKQKVSFGILLLSVVFNIMLNFLLIPHYGIFGAALASVLSYSLCGILFIYTFLRIFEVRFRELLLFDSYEVERVKRLFGRR